MLDSLDDELGDPLAPRDGVGFGRVEVDQDDPKLTPIARIDQAGRVEACDPVLEGEAAARLDESGVAVRQGDGQSRRNQRSTAARLEDDLVARQQIESRVAGPGISGERQFGVETFDWYIEHPPRVLNGRRSEHR